MTSGQEDKAEIVRACFKSYVDKDRTAIEKLIGADFHFTSPLDNRIDRNTYFRSTEFFTVRNGQVADVEVYFGWSIPHVAAAGMSVAANNSKEIQ